MCSISASFDRDKLIELIELNAYRGQHSHSICYYDRLNEQIISLKRAFGPVNYDEIDIPKDMYAIVHSQAPTTEANDYDAIHPAEIDSHLLWHNGIIKEQTLRTLTPTNSKWDTYILLNHMLTVGNLNDIDGSFACLYFNGHNFEVFRNEIAPMFIDKDMNISSTKFEGGEAIPANYIINLNFMFNEMHVINYFQTKNNPYYFG